MSVLNCVNMRPALVGYTLLNVSWVPLRDLFSTTVPCNTIQFIDNWFWDIFHLSLPSGKQASGHTTTEKLQDMKKYYLGLIPCNDFLIHSPWQKKKRCDLINFAICRKPMNQGLNITKCRPGKGQTTEQLACYGQRLQVCNLKYKLAVNTVVCLSGCQSARNLAKKSQLSSAPRKKKV